MLTVVDVFGFGAAAATLLTFVQRRTLPMRVSALAANLLFISYGALGPHLPILILHLTLLPVNCWRILPLVAQRRWRVLADSAGTTLIQEWREPAS